MRYLPPLPPGTSYEDKYTLNMISGGFASTGKTNGTREVYTTNIFTEVPFEMRLRPTENFTISFSDKDMIHVISIHDVYYSSLQTLMASTSKESWFILEVQLMCTLSMLC